MKSSLLWGTILIVALILAIIVILALLPQSTVDDEATVGTLEASPGAAEVMDKDSALPAAEPTSPATTTAAAPVDEATLSAVSPFTGSGAATRSFDGTTFRHTVFTNLADPPADKFYEGWLVMPTADGPNFFSTGKMESQAGSYSLTFTAGENYPDHTNVVITQETAAQGLDNKPEAHVLEGSF